MKRVEVMLVVLVSCTYSCAMRSIEQSHLLAGFLFVSLYAVYSDAGGGSGLPQERSPLVRLSGGRNGFVAPQVPYNQERKIVISGDNDAAHQQAVKLHQKMQAYYQQEPQVELIIKK